MRIALQILVGIRVNSFLASVGSSILTKTLWLYMLFNYFLNLWASLRDARPSRKHCVLHHCWVFLGFFGLLWELFWLTVFSTRPSRKHCKIQCVREGRAKKLICQESSQRSPEIQKVVKKVVKHYVFVKVACLPEEFRNPESSKKTYKIQCVRKHRRANKNKKRSRK